MGKHHKILVPTFRRLPSEEVDLWFSLHEDMLGWLLWFMLQLHLKNTGLVLVVQFALKRGLALVVQSALKTCRVGFGGSTCAEDRASFELMVQLALKSCRAGFELMVQHALKTCRAGLGGSACTEDM